MNSKKRGYKNDTSPPIPSFDQLSQTAETLQREGKLPTLAELLEVREKIQRWYREDHAQKAGDGAPVDSNTKKGVKVE
jgi:hypothetical protein